MPFVVAGQGVFDGCQAGGVTTCLHGDKQKYSHQTPLSPPQQKWMQKIVIGTKKYFGCGIEISSVGLQ